MGVNAANARRACPHPHPAREGRSLLGDERLKVVPCGIGLVSRQTLQPADALILTVDREEFLALSGDVLNSKMTTPRCLVDVKSKLDLNAGSDCLETMKMWNACVCIYAPERW